MTEIPKCPYCGDRMFLNISTQEHDGGAFSIWCQCVTCESTSPHLEFPGSSAYDEVKKKTLDVALHRSEPYNRANPWMYENEDDYGKTWRCWLKKPTEEKRFATNWEEAKS